MDSALAYEVGNSSYIVIMETVVLDQICQTIFNNRLLLAQSLGSFYTVLSPLLHESIQQDKVRPYRWLKHYIKQKPLIQLFLQLNYTQNDSMRLIDNTFVLHSLGMLNYLFQYCYIDFQKDSIYKSVCSLLQTFATLCLYPDHMTEKEKYDCLHKEEKLRDILYGNNPKFNCLRHVSRLRFIKQVIAQNKKRANMGINEFIKNKWSENRNQHNLQVDSLPFADYPVRVAITRLIFHCCTNLSTGKLLSLIEHLYSTPLYSCIEGEPPENRTSSNSHWKQFIIQTLGNMFKSRIESKIWQINEDGCTCHAKCMGPIGDTPLDVLVWKYSFPLLVSLKQCGMCRGISNIENASVTKNKKKFSCNCTDKCRTTFSIHCPEMETCAVDGSSSFKMTSLIDMSCSKNPKTSSLYINFSHHLFTPNIIPLINEIYYEFNHTKCNSINSDDEGEDDDDDDDKVKPTINKKTGINKTCFYGICFNGSRHCLQSYLKICSYKTAIPSFKNTNYWGRCFKCRQQNIVFSIGAEMGISNNAQTCISKFFTEYPKFEAKRLCFGCKLAILCRHFQLYLYSLINKPSNVNQNHPKIPFTLSSKIFIKILILISLQNTVRQLLLIS